MPHGPGRALEPRRHTPRLELDLLSQPGLDGAPVGLGATSREPSFVNGLPSWDAATRFGSVVRAHPEISGLIDWQPLARGGFSTVWQARQEHLDRLVAVKVDHRPLVEDKERRRFLREAGAAGRLSGHPGIVTVHDAGILPDGRPYLVMDLCPGGSLTQWLKPDRRQSEQRIRDVGVRIAAALAAAHARGVLHRDVKPANILIDKYDNVGLADFGLAAIPEPGVDLSVSLEGMTPAYAPKEVFYLKPPTERGDVYSLAATLYALLDGKPPRWPDTGTPSLPELLELQRNPIERLPHVDAAFMDLLLEAMDDDPEQRLSAAEFRDRSAALTFGSDAGANPAVSPSAETTAMAAEPAAEADAVAVRRTATPGRRSRRGPLAAVLLVAAVLATLLLANVFSEGTSPSGAAPQPVTSTTPTPSNPATTSSPTSSVSATPSAKPSPSRIPDGFADCSQQMGGQSYCLTAPECWSQMQGYADLLTQGTMQDCDRPHLYQTYAAGVLKKPVRRQSEAEARPEVRALCNRNNLDRLLIKRKSRKDWQIAQLGPQIVLDDDFFRCLFSTGGVRNTVVTLKNSG